MKKYNKTITDDQQFKRLIAYLSADRDEHRFDVVVNIDDQILVIGDWNEYSDLGSFINQFENSHNIVIGFDDEFIMCDECYKYLNHVSYPSDDFVWSSDCTIICGECAKKDSSDVIENLMNQNDKAFPEFMDTTDLINAGFKCCEHCEGKMAGMHTGMNDTPQNTIDSFCENNDLDHIENEYDYIFVIEGSNPFMVQYSLYVRKYE